jgi:hypothetical protein
MQTVKVYYSDIYLPVVYTGVIGVQLSERLMDLSLYNDTSILIPIDPHRIEYIERKKLTDEEILNGADKEFAAWYADMVEKVKAKEAAQQAEEVGGDSESSEESSE